MPLNRTGPRRGDANGEDLIHLSPTALGPAGLQPGRQPCGPLQATNYYAPNPTESTESVSAQAGQ